MRRPVLLAPLVLLAVLLPSPAPASEPATMMSLAPNAAFTGGAAPLTATSRGTWTDETAVLTITPVGVPDGRTYSTPLTAQGGTGSRWDGTLDLQRGGTPAAPGLYDAAIEVDGVEVESCTGCYTVLARTAPQLRSCADVTPRVLLRGEQRPLHVVGSGFTDRTVLEAVTGTTTSRSVVLDGASALPLGEDTGTLLTRDVSVAPDAALGRSGLRVTGPDGRTSTLAGCLTVTAPADKVEPTGATNDGPVTVSVTVPAVVPTTARLKLTWVGAGAPAPALDLVAPRTTVVPGSPSRLTGTVSFVGATPGLNAYQAGYVLPDGSEHGCDGLCRFTVRQPAPPTVSLVKGLTAGTTALRTVTVTGTGFTRGTTVETDDPDVVVRGVTYGSPTSLTLRVEVRPGVGDGPVTLTVSNPDGGTVDHDAGSAPPPPARPVPATASPDDDPDPSRAPAVPTLRLASTSIAYQQPLLVSGTAEPGSSVDLFALVRPATAPALLRTTVVPESGLWSFTVSPRGSGRLHAVSRNSFGRSASPEVGLQVRSAVTLTVTRTGPLTYTFSGTLLPRRTGGKVDLYYLRGTRQVLLKAGVPVTGTAWSLKGRRFGRAETLVFVARSAALPANAPGTSPRRTVALR